MDLETAKKRYPGGICFRFGDNAELCASLLELVRQGRKTATCEALRVYQDKPEQMPVVGRRDIGLNWDGTPAVVIETTEVTIRRFSEVDEAFALAEGENETLDGWRNDYRIYFGRTVGFSEDMELVCERFRLVEDFG